MKEYNRMGAKELGDLTYVNRNSLSLSLSSISICIYFYKYMDFIYFQKDKIERMEDWTIFE